METTPQDWNERYRQGDTPWEKGAPHPEIEALAQFLPPVTRILVPGCGSGHDVRALTRLLQADVIGLDLAREAILRAEAYPRAGNEEYLLADFFHLPEALHGKFDLVFEHTCFCAIELENRSSYVNSVKSALKKNGIYAAIFYKNPDRDPGETGPPHGVTDEELEERFAEFQLLRRWIPVQTYPGREEREECRIYRRP